MQLIDALWNDPNAQTRVEFTLTGLTRAFPTSSNKIEGLSIAVWNVPNQPDRPDLQVGDAILIAGCTGTGMELLNGRFNISSVFPEGPNTEIRYATAGVPPNSSPITGDKVILQRLSYERVFIALRTDGQLGSGTMEDPFDGSTAETFDAVMRSLPRFTPIHLGPGVFSTRGFTSHAPDAGFQVRPGQKITGSGIDVTTVKIVQASIPGAHYVAFSHDPTKSLAHGVEISEMTVDSNLDGQPNTPGLGYAKVACGAVAVGGSHARLRRIKAIHWGTKAEGVECFVLSVSAADATLAAPDNLGFDQPGIEDCIAVQPSQNSVYTSTIMNVGGQEYPQSHVQTFGRGPYIRNCYVDCIFKHKTTGQPFSSHLITGQPPTPPEAPTAGTRIEGNTGIFVGYRPHNRVTGEYVYFLGAAGSKWTGLREVTTVEDDDKTLTVDLSAASGNNNSNGVTIGATFIGMTLQSCEGGIAERNTILNTWFGGPRQDTFSTREIIIRNNQYRNVISGPLLLNANLSAGPRQVALTQPFPVTNPLLANAYLKDHGFVGGINDDPIHIFRAAPSPDRNVYEGVWVVTVIDKDNFQYTMAFDPGGTASGLAERRAASLVTLKHIGGAVAQAKTVVTEHKLQFGDRILLSNATPDTFNGFFDIINVPDPQTFEYRMKTIPPPPYDDPSHPAEDASFQRVWGVSKLVIEDNQIELADMKSYEVGPPTGIGIVDNDGLVIPPLSYPHGEAVVRGNIIRYVDGILDPGNVGGGIVIQGARKALVSDNFVDTATSFRPHPIEHARSQVHYFNNRTPSGKLVQGFNAVSQNLTSELAVEIEDVLLLSI